MRVGLPYDLLRLGPCSEDLWSALSEIYVFIYVCFNRYVSYFSPPPQPKPNTPLTYSYQCITFNALTTTNPHFDMIALCQAPPHPVQSANNKAVQMSFEFKLPSRVLPSCSFALAGFFSSPLFSLSLISLVTSLLFLFQRSRFQTALEVLHFISPFARLHFFPLNYFQLELPSRLSSFHFICSLHLKLTSSTSRLSSFRSAFSSLQNISSELTLLRVDFTSFRLALPS